MESSNLTSASAEEGNQAQARPHRFGIQSGMIYWGIVVLMASLLLWLGVQLAKRIEWFLPYAGGLLQVHQTLSSQGGRAEKRARKSAIVVLYGRR